MLPQTIPSTMEIWATLPLSLFLLSAAVGLVIWHVRSWRALRNEGLEPQQERFHRRQFRRRMQTSTMLGILAVGLFVGQWLPAWPILMACYWGGMLLLTSWLGLLALADLAVTKTHFRRLRNDYLVEEAKLQAELNRLQRHQSNGRARKRNK